MNLDTWFDSSGGFCFPTQICCNYKIICKFIYLLHHSKTSSKKGLQLPVHARLFWFPTIHSIAVFLKVIYSIYIFILHQLCIYYILASQVVETSKYYSSSRETILVCCVWCNYCYCPYSSMICVYDDFCYYHLDFHHEPETGSFSREHTLQISRSCYPMPQP